MARIVTGKLYDTNVYLSNCRKKYYKKGYIHELLIFDILKNRDIISQKEKYSKLIEYVICSKSNILIREETNSGKLFDKNDFDKCFINALKIAKWHANNLYKMFLDFCIFIIELVLIEKARPALKEDNKAKFEEIIAKITALYLILKEDSDSDIEKKYEDAIFNNCSEDIEKELYIKLINIIIVKVNETLKIDYLHLKTIQGFNTNEIAVKNNIVFDEKHIDEYVDKIVTFSQNSDESKTLYKKYLKDLLLVSGKMQFNDMADINLIYSAWKNNLELVTIDKKINKVKSYFKLLEDK